MFTGGIAIPGACIGIFLGGYLLKRFQLRPSGAVQLVLFFNILCLIWILLLVRLFGSDHETLHVFVLASADTFISVSLLLPKTLD